MDLELTIRVRDGKPSITGPLQDRELCLRLVAEGLRMLLAMQQPGAKPATPAVEVAPPELVGELSRVRT